MRNLVLVGIGLFLGLAAGWLLFGGPPPSTTAKEPEASTTTTRPPERDAAHGTPQPEASTAAAAKAPPRPVITLPAQAAPSDPVALAKENAELRSQLEKLRADAQLTDAERKAAQGEPLKTPENLDARFKQEALLQNVNQALKAAGFDKAQVSSIDCSEYPCIVYGEGLSGPDDFDKLEKSGWAYKDDKVWSASWGDGKGVDGKPGDDHDHSHFAITPRPKDDPNPSSDASKRLRWRYQQMVQSWQSGPGR